MSDTDIQIRAGAAGNQAANALQGVWRAIADGKITQEQVGEVHAFLTAEFFANMSTVAASALLVTHAGATPVQGFAPQQQAPQVPIPPVAQAPAGAFAPQGAPGPFDNVVQGGFQQAAPVPQQAPGAAPDKTTAAWQRYFANPGGYYDNRADKRSPGAPDFKSKSDGDDALWLKGKFGNAPDWVWANLGYAPGTY